MIEINDVSAAERIGFQQIGQAVAVQVDEIATALKARLDRNVNLTTEIDENLIGGAVIRAGDVVIDGSVRSRLEGLATALVA